MSEQRENQEPSRQKLPDAYRKVDHQYGESKHYLVDQLRYSDSVQDFRSVKQSILRSTQFSVGNRAFQFAKVTVEAEQKRRR